MNYYKINLNSIFSSLFIFSLFMSDFGLLINGQSIYLFQLLALAYTCSELIFKSKIEKGWLLFFIAVIISIIANVSILDEGRQFAGDTYPLTSIKGFINIFIFYAVYKTFIFSYHRVNPNLFFYLSIFMIIYGFVELSFGSNHQVQQILNFFHTNPSAVGTRYLSLLGREHSYGALGYLVGASFMIYFYINKSFKGFKSIFVVPFIVLLIVFAVLAESKSGYLSLLFFGFFIIILLAKDKIMNIKIIFLISIIGVFLTILALNFMSNNWHTQILDSINGEIGSGSTYTRWVSLLISIELLKDNIFWGVGPGNFKLFYVDYVYLLNFPIVHDLRYWVDPTITAGSIDSLNFFAGILSEFGIITFIVIFYIIFKRVFFLFFNTNLKLKKLPLSMLISPIFFGASFGFYYWAISFFPLFLAILKLEYDKYKDELQK